MSKSDLPKLNFGALRSQNAHAESPFENDANQNTVSELLNGNESYYKRRLEGINGANIKSTQAPTAGSLTDRKGRPGRKLVEIEGVSVTAREPNSNNGQNFDIHPQLVPARPVLTSINRDNAKLAAPVDELDLIQFPSSYKSQNKATGEYSRFRQPAYKSTGKQQRLQPMDSVNNNENNSSYMSSQLNAIANASDPLNMTSWIDTNNNTSPRGIGFGQGQDKGLPSSQAGSLTGLWDEQVAPPKEVFKRRVSSNKTSSINNNNNNSFYNPNNSGSKVTANSYGAKGSKGGDEPPRNNINGNNVIGNSNNTYHQLKMISEIDEEKGSNHGNSNVNNQSLIAQQMTSMSLSSPINGSFPSPFRQGSLIQDGTSMGPSNGEIGSTGLSPAIAIQHKANKLTDSELSEILDFPLVYFFGEKDVKIKVDLSKPNRGYDDDRGDYKGHLGDHLFFRFELLENIGKGSFGQVFKTRDHKKGNIVAVKIIRNKKRFQQQAKIEIRILNRLKVSDAGARANCIQIQETFEFRNHTCLVFPLYGLNLYEYLKGKGFRGCSLPFVRQIAIQLLDCLTFLGKNNIIHCDLKPENILLKDEKRASIVIIDFGSSCFVRETIYTYIQSRFYRSPEVILGFEYGPSIDLWSFACILPELYTAYPVFPGENEVDQLACISELIGHPPTHLSSRCTRKKQLFHETGELRIQPSPRGKIRQPNSRPFSDLGGGRQADPVFVSFIQRCLKWDPEERPIPEQLMQHPWIDNNGAISTAREREQKEKERARLATTTNGRVI